MGIRIIPSSGCGRRSIRRADRFIGRCGLIPWTIDGALEIEVAYLLDRQYWRQGLGAEVAGALVRYGFEQLQLPRLIALIDPAHQASTRTAESAGLRFEREVELEGVRSSLYAIAKAPRSC